MKKINLVVGGLLLSATAVIYHRSVMDVRYPSIKDIKSKYALIYDQCLPFLEKYKENLKDDLPDNLKPDGKYENCVWTMWFQGEENAPPIVKNCLKSVKKYCPNRKIVVLDQKNIEKYIKLPPYIVEKHKNGQIPSALFSDIVRYCLLYKYGGTWIDSTVLMSGEIPQKILNEDFFMFKIFGLLQRKYFLTANWFIHSKPGNIIMADLVKLCFAYWKQEDKPVDYFLNYFFFTMAVKNDPEAKKMFDNMISLPERMHFYEKLPKPFSEESFEELKSISDLPLHKMTYKLKKKHPGSLYEYLSKEDLF